MWGNHYWNALHNPHYHTACPTDGSWHNSDFCTLLPMIPETPGTKVLSTTKAAKLPRNVLRNVVFYPHIFMLCHQNTRQNRNFAF